MLFNSVHNLRLLNIRTFTSKAGNECTFLTLADPETFENVDFMPVRGTDVSKLTVGTDYLCVLHADGRYTNVELKVNK